jgi:hypothetical protein
VKTTIPFAIVSSGLIAMLTAGEAPSPSPAPASDSGRHASDTELPGYAVATASYSHGFAADFDSLPGEVSSDEFSVWAPILPLNKDNYHLLAYLGYGADKFDTSEPTPIPDDTLQSVSLPITFIHDVSDTWMWGAMVMPTYAGNSGSSDNFTMSAGLGVGYSYSPTLELFAGCYYANDFGDDFFMPGVAFIWRPAPRWEAYLLPPIGGISYSVNEHFLVSLYGQYSSPTWFVKADDNGPDRYVNMSNLRIGLKAEYQLSGMLWGYVAGGYSMMQELDVQDTDNDTIENSDIDPSPYIQAGLNIRF